VTSFRPEWACSAWAVLLGAYDEAERLTERAIAAAGSPDDPDLALAWFASSWAAWYTGRPDAALAADTHAKQLADPAHDRVAAYIATLWIHPTARFFPAEGPAQVAKARALVADLDNDAFETTLALHGGHAWFGAGDHERALELWRRAVVLAERAGLTSFAGYALAALAIRSADVSGSDPRPLFREAISGLHGLGVPSYSTWAITGLAGWWAGSGRVEQAAHLIGFLDAKDPGGNQTYADVRSRAATLVRQDPRAAVWEASGATMTRDEIVDYSLRHLDQSG
jgi:tetratricopeptide (TPR) repeat protein